MDGLVYVIDVAGDDGLGYVREHTEKCLHLTGHPTEALALEVVTVANFFVHYIDIFGIANKDALFQEQGFQFAVFNGRVKLVDIFLKPLVVEAHARTDEGRGHTDAIVSATEDTVVDFLADSVKCGDAVVCILGCAVALDGFAGIGNSTEFGQEV